MDHDSFFPDQVPPWLPRPDSSCLFSPSSMCLVSPPRADPLCSRYCHTLQWTERFLVTHAHFEKWYKRLSNRYCSLWLESPTCPLLAIFCSHLPLFGCYSRLRFEKRSLSPIR